MIVQLRKWAANRIALQRRKNLDKRLDLLRMARVFESPSDWVTVSASRPTGY